MLNQPQPSPQSDGLLSDKELDEIIASYVGRASPAAIDEQVRELLGRRDAVSEWELTERENGVECLSFLAHRFCGRITFGNIYDVLLAQHLFLGRVDVVKILRRDKLDILPRLVGAHLRRSRVQSSVQSPHIVAVHDAGYHRGAYFVLVEQVIGRDLLAIVSAHGPLSVSAAAEIGAQLALGIDALHSRGYVHGTLRPTKVLVSESGCVKLADVGVARPPGPFDWAEDDFQLRGDYLAPELIRRKTSSFLTDIYLLGCVLYYAVTGCVLFPGGTTKEKASSHSELSPRNLKLIRHDLDDDFVQLVNEMIAKRPEERIQSIAELTRRLHFFSKGS